MTAADALLNIDDVVKLLKLSKSKIYELVSKGELVAVKFGAATRFRPADVEALVKRSLTQAPKIAHLTGVR